MSEQARQDNFVAGVIALILVAMFLLIVMGIATGIVFFVWRWALGA